MTIRTIDDGVLNSPEAEAYFTTKANAHTIIRTGEAKPLPEDMTPPQRSRLAAAAAEVVASYRRAGSPGLLKRIHSTQHFVHSCAVNAALEEAQPEGEGQ
ncbi:hypothetical protein [Brevundimonas bullata]|uniref:hypothetical protein n=1 Tax=Brevundimonas bullata TaxID=13160 RepID=UPI003D9AAC71